MKRRTIISLLLVFLVPMSLAYAGEPVSLKGTPGTGDTFVLKGILDKPAGQGPFPAIVMLPGGGGFNRAGFDRWVDRFVDWGYVALRVETLASRGYSNISEGGTGGMSPAVSKEETAQDAFDAKDYLLGFAFVDANRIAVCGWGFGGGAVLRVIDPSVRLQNRSIPFKAAVAFYPMCDQPLMEFDTPLLVLNGGLATWHPAIRCRVVGGRSTLMATQTPPPMATRNSPTPEVKNSGMKKEIEIKFRTLNTHHKA